VHAAAVDVTDETQLRSFLDDYRAQAWPEIRGVVHAAGTHDNRLAATMDRAAFDAAVAPKLAAARLLDRLLPELEAFVMISSIGSFLAQPGQANYAAANAGLDALAIDRRARGLPAVSLAWGVWKDTGLVANAAGARNVDEMERQGVRAFAPERGAMLFSRLAAQAEPYMAVMPVDWAAFKRARGGRDFPVFRDLLEEAAGQASGAGDLGVALAGATPAQRRQLLEPVVRATVGRVLKIPPARLDPRKALGTMGLNSLMAMELRNRLEAALGRSLSATLAWNYPTVEALVEHLAGADAKATPGAVPAQPAAPPAGPLAQRLTEVAEAVAAVSDEDAARALRRRPAKK
jgi:acyl carrier protein